LMMYSPSAKLLQANKTAATATKRIIFFIFLV
jgi:hypothetical protein